MFFAAYARRDVLKLLLDRTNASSFYEFKGVGKEVPYEYKTFTLMPEDRILHLAKSIGSGVKVAPDFIVKHNILKV